MSPLDPIIQGVLQTGAVQRREAARRARLRTEEHVAAQRTRHSEDPNAVRPSEAAAATLDSLTHQHQPSEEEDEGDGHVDVRA